MPFRAPLDLECYQMKRDFGDLNYCKKQHENVDLGSNLERQNLSAGR